MGNDPMLAAIEDHRAAERMFFELMRVEGCSTSDATHLRDLSLAAQEARASTRRLLETEPTNVAGVIAVLRYAAECAESGKRLEAGDATFEATLAPKLADLVEQLWLLSAKLSAHVSGTADCQYGRNAALGGTCEHPKHPGPANSKFWCADWETV